MPHRETQPDTQSGDSFAAFYTTTVERTFLAARRIAAGDRQLAFDAVQDAYVVLLQQWPDRCRQPATTNHRYVVRIAAHKVIDRYRLQNRQTPLDDDYDHPAGYEPVVDLINELSLLRAVRALIGCQPPRRRAVATLFFLEEAGYDEIAAALGITESTVRTHVERMRNLLKPLIDRINQLDEGGVSHE